MIRKEDAMKKQFGTILLCITALSMTFVSCNAAEDDSVYTIQAQQSEYSVSLVNDAVKTAQMQISMTKDDEEYTSSKITYASKDNNIATIDDKGVITAVAAGETDVIASFGSEDKEIVASSHVVVYGSASDEEINTYDEAYVNLYGRTYTDSEKLVLDNAATAVEIAFYGTELTLNVYNSGSGSAKAKLRCFIDGEEYGTETVLTKLSKTRAVEYVAATGLGSGIHTARIVKASSPQYGVVCIDDITTDGSFLTAKAKPELKIEFIGDSITAGFGSVGSNPDDGTIENSDCSKSYAYLTAQALNADYDVVALEGICAKDGTTNMYDKYTKISVCNSALAYDPSSFQADYVVVALGENDTWHANSSAFPYTMKQLKTDYAEMLQLVRSQHPDARIICLYGMMESSDKYMEIVLNSVLKTIEDDKITTLHVSPNTTGGGYHPNEASHRFYAKALTEHINSLGYVTENG